MEEVEARLLTDLPEKYRLPTATFSLPTEITAEGLNQLVKQQVSLSDRLLFSVSNVVITTTLGDLMKEQKLTAESLLEIWYSLALPLPNPQSSHLCPDWVSSCAFLSPSTLIAADYSGQLAAFVDCLPAYSEKVHSFPIKSISVAPEQSLIAIGGKDGVIKAYHYRKGEFELQGEGRLSSVESLAWNPTGTMLAVGLYRGEIHIASLNTEESAMLTKATKRQKLNAFGLRMQRLSVPHSDAVSGLQWPELDVIYTASHDHSVIVWDISQEAAIFSYTAPRSIQSFQSASRLLACGFESGEIRIVDERSSRVVATFASESYVRALAWHRGGLISGHEDGSMKIWDLRSTAPLESAHTHDGKILTMAQSGAVVATGGSDSTVRFHSFTS